MPYKPTGKPPGRPKGANTKAPIKRGQKRAVGRQEAIKSERTTIEQVDAKVALALIEHVLPKDVEPFKGGAVEFLMSLYKDPLQPLPVRLDAAKAAAKYESPALQAITVTKSDPFDHIEDADELRRALQTEAVSVGVVPPPHAGGKGRPRGEPGPVRH